MFSGNCDDVNVYTWAQQRQTFLMSRSHSSAIQFRFEARAFAIVVTNLQPCSSYVSDVIVMLVAQHTLGYFAFCSVAIAVLCVCVFAFVCIVTDQMTSIAYDIKSMFGSHLKEFHGTFLIWINWKRARSCLLIQTSQPLTMHCV